MTWPLSNSSTRVRMGASSADRTESPFDGEQRLREPVSSGAAVPSVIETQRPEVLHLQRLRSQVMLQVRARSEKTQHAKFPQTEQSQHVCAFAAGTVANTTTSVSRHFMAIPLCRLRYTLPKNRRYTYMTQPISVLPDLRIRPPAFGARL